MFVTVLKREARRAFWAADFFFSSFSWNFLSSSALAPP